MVSDRTVFFVFFGFVIVGATSFLSPSSQIVADVDIKFVDVVIDIAVVA